MTLFESLNVRSRVGGIVLALVVLIGLLGSGIYFLQKSRLADNARQEARIDAAMKEIREEEAASKAAEAGANAHANAHAAKPAKPIPVDLVVRKGEGVEHPLIRQLEADPSIADNLPSRFTGNRNDLAAVRRWAGHEVAVLAIKAGLVGWEFGEEYRIKAPDTIAVSFVRDPNGGLVIVQYAASTLVEKTPATDTVDTAAKVAPPIPSAPQNVSVAGVAYQQVAAFTVASSVAKSHVPFMTRPSGEIVFHSPFAYIEDGVPPQNG